MSGDSLAPELQKDIASEREKSGRGDTSGDGVVTPWRSEHLILRLSHCVLGIVS
jgi:hypothetical protein